MPPYFQDSSIANDLVDLVQIAKDSVSAAM